MIKSTPKRVSKLSVVVNLIIFISLFTANYLGKEVFTFTLWLGFAHYICSVLNYNLYVGMFDKNKEILTKRPLIDKYQYDYQEGN